MTQRPDEPTSPWQARPTPPPEAAAPDSTASAAAGEKEWWDAPGMPWKHKPGRADKACMAWIMVIGVYGLAILPLRGWLLGKHTALLASLTGSRSATTATGALASQHLVAHWPLVLLAASVMSIKLDWVYWWAGKLWGRGMIEVWAGRSARAHRNYERAERWAHKLGWVGMLVAYVPIPLPLMPVIFVLAGSTGMSLRKFLVLDFISSTIWLVGYFMLGWKLGDAAVEVLKQYARIGNYVAIALVVFVVASTVWAQRKRPA